jgi:hypothetical protein
MGAPMMMDQGYSPQPGGVLLSNVNYIPPGLESKYKEPFSYNIIFASIGAGVQQTGTANIQNDSYFVCTQQMMEIWDVATGNTTNTLPQAAPMLARILDSSSGKFQMDQPTPVANLFGTAQQPKVWLYRARLYLPGGQVTLELTNGMATAQRVRVTFEGFKVYKVPDELPMM